MPSLTRAEAVTRAALLTVDAMEVALDLDRGTEVFGSRTTIRFTARTPGAATFVDLRPRALHAVTLNGHPLDPASMVDGRLDLTGLAADNVLEVDATMAYSHDGQGLHRSTDPADGEDYVYGHLFLDAAPTVFACFDQPDLKAPYTVAVTAPAEWTVLGNGGATGRRARLHRAGHDTPAGDLLRHRVRRSVGVGARRARRHPAGGARAALARALPRRAGRAHLRHDPGVLRLLPPVVRHQVPVRRVPPGLRARVQRRRHGEPGVRHLPRHDDLPRRGHAPTRCWPAATSSPTRWRTCGSATSSR